MAKEKALFISQEIVPYLAETPMALRGRYNPQGIQERGYEVRTFMPKYGCINERRNQLHEVIRLSGMNIIIDDTDHPLIIKVATLQPARMQVYFIDSDDYFERSSTKGLETAVHPEDNDERVIFYVRGVVETVKKLRWEPAVIHCSGWISALAPLYLKKVYNEDPSFRNSKVVFSLFSAQCPEPLGPGFVDKLKADDFTDDDLRALGDDPAAIDAAALNRLAMAWADGIIVESPDVDPALLEAALATGKPVLEWIDDEDDQARYDRYEAFYHTL